MEENTTVTNPQPMTQETPIPPDEWRTVVQHVPIVSVDLVVQQGDSVLLGKRTNDPAKGEWFVPGGRVHKHEQLVDAVHRVARDELGSEVTIERQLGVYEHFYDTAEVADVGGKHYVPTGFLVRTDSRDIQLDGQHNTFRWFSPPFDSIDLHPYVRTYLADADILSQTA